MQAIRDDSIVAHWSQGARQNALTNAVTLIDDAEISTSEKVSRRVVTGAFSSQVPARSW